MHDPEILLLDEPFNGMDPRQRLHMTALVARLGAEGRVILFSSHILEDVEKLAGTIQVMVAGRLAASGDFRAIRRLMTSRPHVFSLRSSEDRRLAAALVGRPYTTAVELGSKGLQVRTSDFGEFCAQIAPLVREQGITLRATLGRRRAFAFAIPAVILIALTLVLRRSHPVGATWPDNVLGNMGFSVLLPLTALIIGTGVLGAEIDDGSAIHLLATPVRRTAIVLTKFAVAALLTMLFAAVPELIAGLLAPNSAGLAWALFVGALARSVIYTAVFVMASVLTTRAIAVGLLYVLIWEALLSNLVGGVRILSIAHYSLGVANAIHHDPNLKAGLPVDVSDPRRHRHDWRAGHRVPAPRRLRHQGRARVTREPKGRSAVRTEEPPREPKGAPPR
ncbi:MAG TPA: ABC transporter permease subunit [Trebonia sp.]